MAPGQEDLLLLAGAQDLESGAEFLKLAQDQSNHMLHLLVWIFDDAFIRESYQSRGQALHILTASHFTQAACIEALLHQRVLCLRHGPLQPKQKSVVREAGIVDAIRIANERAQQGRSISELIPLGVVTRQTRDRPPEHNTDVAQGDLGGQRFKVIALLTPRSRLAQVAIEHLNALRMPAQVCGPTDQGALRELTVEILPHLLGARLANVDHGLALEMSRGDFHLA